MAENKLPKTEDTSDSLATPVVGSAPAKTSLQPPKMDWKDRKSFLTIVGILILLVGGGYALYKHNHPSAPKTYPYQQTFSTLANHKFAGGADGRGITFEKPDIFATQQNVLSGQSFVQLAKSTKNDGSYIAIARLMVTTRDTLLPGTITGDYLQGVARDFKADVTSSAYKETVSTIQTFAKTGFPEPTITVTLGKAQAFTNSNIKFNAWQFDLTSSDSSGATPAHTGKVIFAIGKNTFYRFMIAATDQNWQANSASFQQVIKSIKIDQ